MAINEHEIITVMKKKKKKINWSVKQLYGYWQTAYNVS